MKDNSSHSKIDSYLLHQMTESERREFEATVLTDKDLANELEQKKVGHAVMQALVAKGLRKQLKKWETEEETPQSTLKKKPFYVNRLTWIVVGLLLILGLILFLLSKGKGTESKVIDQDRIENKIPGIQEPTVEEDNSKNKRIEPSSIPQAENIEPTKENPKQESKEEKETNYLALAESYSETLNFKETVRKGDNSNYAKGLEALNNGKYKFAIQYFSMTLIKEPKNNSARYRLGLGYYQLNKIDQAIPYLEEVVSDDFFLQHQKAVWVLALAHLKNNDPQSAKPLLKELSLQKDHLFYEQATALLRLI